MRISTLLRALVVGTTSGLALTLIGVHGYSLLARANLRHAPEIPWAPLVALPLLWAFWRAAGGWGFPRRASGWCARMRRAEPVPRRLWMLTAGAATAWALFALVAMSLALRLSDLPADALRILPRGVVLPWWTHVSALAVLALVAGVAEEVGVRGYLQRPIEEAGFPVLAVGYSALVFTLLHANQEWFLEQALPMFVAACGYGHLTLAARSIYPMVAVHASIDAVLFLRYSVLEAPIPASVRTAGFTATFWIEAALALGLGVLGFALTTRLARRRGQE